MVRIGLNAVRLGIEAPKDMNIVREELGPPLPYIEVDVPLDDVTVPSSSGHGIQVTDARTSAKQHAKPVGLLPTRPRVCLKCDSEFASTGVGHRVCDDCKSGKNRLKKGEQSALPASSGWQHGRFRHGTNTRGE